MTQFSHRVLHYHGRERRGVRSVYLKEKPHPKIKTMLEREEGKVKTWELRAGRIGLPNDDHTHYWCRIFRAPRETEDKKHHMIAVRTIEKIAREKKKRSEC